MESNNSSRQAALSSTVGGLNQEFKGKIDYIQELQTIWKNEKFCQDLLPYNEDCISRLIEKIEKKENEIKEANKDSTLDKETLNILELDIQRIKFCIKDYLRIRLCKIEKYLFYILKNDLSDLLSQNEIKFVVSLINMKSVYFNEGMKKLSVLVNNFKPFLDKYKTMADKVSAVSNGMIITPPANAYVIVESVAEENLIINIKEIYENYEHEFLVLECGETAVVPYLAVKELIKNKKVKLI